MNLVRTWLCALALLGAMGLLVRAPVHAQQFEDVPRGGAYKKYEGNPKWSGDTVYALDKDLGTPPSSAPEFGPWVDVGGRKVRVVSRYTQRARFQGRSDANMTFHGLEDEAGKVLLPAVYRAVHAVPGRGVYVQSYLGQQAFVLLDVKTGKQTAVPNLIRVMQHTLGAKRFEGAVLIYQTGETKVAAPQTTRSRDFSPVATGAPVSGEKIVSVGRIEVYGADGQLARVLGDLAPIEMSTQPPLYGSTEPRPYPIYLRMRSDSWFVGLVMPSRDLAMQALDASFAPVGNVFPWAVDSGSALVGFVAPAPDVPDAWVRITDKGQMAAPPGALAYRPLTDGVMSAAWALASAYEGNGKSYSSSNARWLVAYPAADGARWGYLEADGRTATGPLWREVIHLQTELTKEAWALFGPQVAVQKLDGSWSLMSRTFGQLEPQSFASLAEVLDASEAKVLAKREQQRLAAAAQAAREQQAAKSKEQERWDRWNFLKEAGSWQELRQVSEIWGGDYFASYIKLSSYASLSDVKRAIFEGGGTVVDKDYWDRRLKEAEANAKKLEQIRLDAEMSVTMDKLEREKEARLFRPSATEWSGYVDSTQRLRDYNASVAHSNCAVADLGGLRSCSRN
jgi:hypothetical protein